MANVVSINLNPNASGGVIEFKGILYCLHNGVLWEYDNKLPTHGWIKSEKWPQGVDVSSAGELYLVKDIMVASAPMDSEGQHDCVCTHNFLYDGCLCGGK